MCYSAVKTFHTGKAVHQAEYLNLLAPELFFLILAHFVYKM